MSCCPSLFSEDPWSELRDLIDVGDAKVGHKYEGSPFDSLGDNEGSLPSDGLLNSIELGRNAHPNAPLLSLLKIDLSGLGAAAVLVGGS
jgi:hypothetical protein